uniref:E3 ubiquitin-protein ligase SH3RF1-like isoform X2 n=1 Tax=Myxine glutinosa TaxID=7769 RepID=UPI00358F087B
MMDESSLLDLLECPVCLERLDATAKVLPCQHTFCKRCLQSIVTSRQGELRCPECRYLVRCAVEDLPANILLLRLLDGITRGQGPPRGVRVARAAAAAAAAVGATSSSSSTSPGACNGAPASSVTLGRSVSLKQGFPTLPCARALYSYEGKDPGDLAFTKGDLIILRRRVDESWYQGETSSRQGFFPASYVQVLRPLPLPPNAQITQQTVLGPLLAMHSQGRAVPAPQCRALYDFSVSGGEQDKDCLTFAKDEVLTVIRRVDENWAEGMLGDKIGIFPISFVEFNVTAKQMLGLDSATGMGLTSAESTALAMASTAQGAGAGDCRKNAKKRHSFTSLPMASKLSQQLQQQQQQQQQQPGGVGMGALQHRHSCDISAPVLVSSSNPAAAARIASSNGQPLSTPSQIYIGTTGLIVSPSCSSPITTTAPVSCLSEPVSSSGSTQPSEGSTVATPSAAPVPSQAATPAVPAEPTPVPRPPYSFPLIQIYVALYPYKPQKADELELRKGEMYRVLERCQDGWYKGASLRTGIAGVFPGNYVMPVNRSAPPQKQTPATTSANGRSTMATTPVTVVTTPQVGHSTSNGSPSSAPPTSPRLAAAARQASQLATQNGMRPGLALDKPMATVPPIQSQSGSPRAPHPAPRPMVSQPLAPPYPGTCSSPAYRATPSLSALASVASAITPPNVTATSLDDASGLASATAPGVSGTPSVTVPAGMAKNDRVDKDKKEWKGSFLKILSSASTKRKSRSPPLSSSPPAPSLEDSQPMGAEGHTRSLTPPIAPPPRLPCSAMAPARPEGKTLPRERYRAVVPYPPQSEAELELREGDVVFVHRKREDGWFKGTLQRSGKTGLFPGSFVESF